MSELLVITGASRGIGLATARRFLARGAAVVNLSRSPCPLPGVVQLTVDLALPGFEQAIEAPLLAAAAGCARLVLIHNAALFESDSALGVDPLALSRTLAVALLAPAVLNRLLLPKMPRGSSILYVGSTLSEKAVASVFSYTISKHGVVGMMRATCQDLLGRGIHTVCVCPGLTETEMVRQRAGGDPEKLAELSAMTGEGRMIQPDEIAAVLEAAADHPVMNGTVLHANLGQRER